MEVARTLLVSQMTFKKPIYIIWYSAEEEGMVGSKYVVQDFQNKGMAVDGVMQTLLDRGLVERAGRAEVIGRPMNYATTSLFLEYFGLRSLEDLPAADELRRIPVTRPEQLLTADPGLATVPPDQLTLAEAESPESRPASETPSEIPPPA